MNPAFDAFLRSWPSNPALVVSLVLTAAIYTRGWLELRRRSPRRWHAGPLIAFLGGLFAIFLALGSPIESFASLLLSVHMLQHLLLLMVAPALVCWGAPFFPLLRGLPRAVREVWVSPLLRVAGVRRFSERLTHPWVALSLFVSAIWIWHAPGPYDWALRSDAAHYIEHACFLAAGLLFWYPVLRPYPSRPRWSLWLLAPYLILADVQNTILSALLTFSSHPLYSYYTEVPPLGGLSALSDQAVAGVIMWVPGSVAFLVPLFAIGVRLLFSSSAVTSASRRVRLQAARVPTSPLTPSPSPARGEGGRVPALVPLLAPQAPTSNSSPLSPCGRGVGGEGYSDDVRTIARAKSAIPIALRELPVLQPVARRSASSAGFDLLQTPVLGRFLRWRHARLAVQLPLVLLAGVVIADGLCGPQIAAVNLAGVLPWTHWRGLLILSLVVAGNFSCMACPFTVPRRLAGRWLGAGLRWPGWLRTKWLSLALVAIFLWTYETCSLWASPWWTAWIVVGYFVTAFAVDSLFRAGTFCKYVCPIGQFNFVQSLASPLEIKVRAPERCASCRTHECIRGSATVPGCPTRLFLPHKSSNMDCTFCLDCVHACPHDNVGLIAGLPGRALWTDRVRSGIGRFAERPDLAALAVVLTFGALANAAGMVGPVVEWLDRARLSLGEPPAWVVMSLFALVTLVVLPAASVSLVALASRRWGGIGQSPLAVATRFSFALVPMGLGVWLSHYSFHFLTSWETALPATQRALGGLGWTFLGPPRYQRACCRPVGDWLVRLQLLFADGGLLLSLYAGYRIARDQTSTTARALRAFAPWAVLILLLFAAAIWIVFQPMQMRGTLPGAAG